MRFYFITFFCVIITTGVFSQSDIDDLLDDPKNTFSLNVGMNIFETIFGSPNIYVEPIFHDMYYANLEVGAPVFGYKSEDLSFEKKVEGGYYYTVGAGGYWFDFPNWIEGVRMSLGLQFRHWNYETSNAEIFYGYGIRNSADPFSVFGTYNYESNGQVKLIGKKKSNYLGPRCSIEYRIAERFRLLWSINVYLGRERFMFDHEKSSGISWVDNQPADWLRGSVEIDGGLSVLLTFEL